MFFLLSPYKKHLCYEFRSDLTLTFQLSTVMLQMKISQKNYDRKTANVLQ